MKKNYISPLTMVDEIAMVNCLCLSLMEGTASDDPVLAPQRTEVEVGDNDFDF